MRRVMFGIGTVLLAVTAGVVGTGTAYATVQLREYVALGDSYASGVGAPPYDTASGDCRQSPKSYPRIWAKNHPAFTLKDMTCSGAKIDDVRNSQMSALSTSTTLVTITIGGNDDGFTGTANACLTGSDESCAAATNLGAYVARHELVDRLAGLYTDVRSKAPNAKVIVLSYPNLINQGTGSCGALTPNAFKRSQILFNTVHMAEGMQTAADRAGVDFIDMRLPFDGHEACSADPYINGVDPNFISEIFHPNATGHVAYAFFLTLQTNHYPETR